MPFPHTLAGTAEHRVAAERDRYRTSLIAVRKVLWENVESLKLIAHFTDRPHDRELANTLIANGEAALKAHLVDMPTRDARINEPRGCPECEGTGSVSRFMGSDKRNSGIGHHVESCPHCKGTGRLGVEGAEPDVEVFAITAQGCREKHGGITLRPIETQWYWALRGAPKRGEQMPHDGPFPTEAAALEAARDCSIGREMPGMTAIGELEALSMQVYGRLVDVCEAWVARVLIDKCVNAGVLNVGEAAGLRCRLNNEMRGVGEFPI